MSTHGIDSLAGLNAAQRAAAEQTEGPVLVLAGAGSGKTRVLAHRIAHIVQQNLAKPWQILAVTFTNKAAQELKDRVAAITTGGDRVAAGTFHSIMLRLLRQEAEAIGYPRDFTIFDNTDSVRLVKMILNDYGEDRYRPRTIHSIISRLKNDLVDPGEFAGQARTPLEKTAARAFEDYERRIKQHAAMDFDDLLIKPLRLLKNHPSVLNTWSSRWRYIHVDEYQDTNLAQFELIKTLAGPRPNLFAVGDDDQSIYGWRGARVENVFRFRESFKGAKVFRLEQNYRSTQPILELAHAIVSKSSKREEKKLWTDRKGGQKPVVVGVPTDMDEAREVADRIGREVMTGNRAFSDYAVLYRTNAQSRLFEDVFRSRRYPYQIVGSLGFYDRKEVRDAIAYFKLCLNPRDDLALRRIVSEPPRGIGTTTLERVSEFAVDRQIPMLEALGRTEEIGTLRKAAVNACTKFATQVKSWRDDLENLSPEAWAEQVLEDSGYLGRLREEKAFEAQGRIDNLEALVGSVAEFSARGGTLAEYMEDAALSSDQDKYDPDADTIRLMTVHAAKGLEFPVVFVTGMEKNMFPLQNEDEPADMDEERRLFYVAVTRARQDLVLTYAYQRRVWGQLSFREPSIFLKELPEEGVHWKGYREQAEPTQGRFGVSDPGGLPSPGSRGRREPHPSAARPNKGAPGTKPSAGASGRSAGDVPAVRPGDLVEHPRFGKGIVLATTKWRNDIKVSVEFDGTGVMQLIQGKARLQPVKDFS